eukprot:2416706-Rhodomonas_salina.2
MAIRCARVHSSESGCSNHSRCSSLAALQCGKQKGRRFKDPCGGSMATRTHTKQRCEDRGVGDVPFLGEDRSVHVANAMSYTKKLSNIPSTAPPP